MTLPERRSTGLNRRDWLLHSASTLSLGGLLLPGAPAFATATAAGPAAASAAAGGHIEAT